MNCLFGGKLLKKCGSLQKINIFCLQVVATTWLVILASSNFKYCNAAMTIALNSTGKWPNGFIPYRFDQSITNYTKLKPIIIAMQQIEQFTGGCIRFRKHKDERDFVIIQDESYTQSQTCFSYVGRTGNWQPVRFSTYCLNSVGDVTSLLTRVVGLYPESNRPDRDQYIAIQWDNILKDKVQEYAIIPYSYQMNVFTTTGYDFASITHYTQSQFVRSSSLKTWLLQPGVPHPGVEVGGTIGQRIGLSLGDVAAIRYLYNCNYSATLTPEIGCKGDDTSSSTFQRGKAAGWFFCKCNQNNETGDTYFYGERCQYTRCTPDCSKMTNAFCDTDETGHYPRTKCSCNSGWQGELCDQFYCATPCLNGGVCVWANQCRCPPEYYQGGNCASLPSCYPICRNDGECVLGSDSTAMCRCQDGWSGKDCSEASCTLPCLNGGECVAPDICDCPIGYTGLRCENSNVTFGMPCTNNYDCVVGWGDPNSYCNLNSSCPGVSHTCICSAGYERLPSGGPCRNQRHFGEKCSWLYDVCGNNSECIEGTCRCNDIKGWVKGPLNDCVKATKTTSQCKYWDDCLYNKTCSSYGYCECPVGMLSDDATNGYTCRTRQWGESCSTDDDCKYVGVGAVCRTMINPDGSAGIQGCDCSRGIPYEYLVDRYTIGKTCLPPFPQRWGERCSVDFSNSPKYGPCERGLVCELCPRTNDEYRCQNYLQPAIIGSANKNHFSSFIFATILFTSFFAFSC